MPKKPRKHEPTLDFRVDQQKLAETISLLTALYNVPDEPKYRRAVALLDESAITSTSLVPVRADLVKSDSRPFLSTGVAWLDEWWGGGIRKGEELILGAMPFTGKTRFASWVAGNCALDGAVVAHFYSEDLDVDLQEMYSQVVGKKALQNIWLVSMTDYTFNAQQVGEVLRRMKRDGIKVDVVVLDNMDTMQSVQTKGGDWQDAAGVAREIKVLAVKENVFAIAISQAHEKTKERKGQGRFYRAKIGKSSQGDLIVLLDRVIDNEYHFSRIKAKGRKVGMDTVEKVLEIDWDAMTIEDITH